jgi:nucleotide-binding universal stress UspA family protein
MSVVVGYIATPEGRAALDVAVQEAKLRGTELVVVNGTLGDSLHDPRFASDADMAQVRASLDTAGVDVRIVHEAGTEATDQILALASQEGVQLVVIGMRRRSPVGKLLMGSRAQRILLESDAPVLAVKAGA